MYGRGGSGGVGGCIFSLYFGNIHIIGTVFICPTQAVSKYVPLWQLRHNKRYLKSTLIKVLKTINLRMLFLGGGGGGGVLHL